MICPKCQKEVEQNMKFCTNCGHSFLNTDEKLVKLYKNENIELACLIKFGIASIIIGLLFMLL